MNTILKTTALVLGMAAAAQASAQITFFEHDNFEGREFTTQRQVGNFRNQGFNDRASSVVVRSERWEVCEDANFGGRCVVLRPGSYASLGAMGLNDRLSSVRSVSRNARLDDDRFAPPPVVDRDFRRRQNERLYQADVTGVRAVLATPERRCWMEREQLPSEQRSSANVPAGIVGAVIGGILGHQVGGGTGRDIATVGGAVGGAVIGSRMGRDHTTSGGSQTVQRCENVPGQARTEYWDVSYRFRGTDHHVQMTTPPGATITVNRQGEPRV